MFEKQALASLTALGFTPSGYYEYEHYADVCGYMKPSPPFTIPVKVVAEIVKRTPTHALIDGFHKLAREWLADRMIMIFPSLFSKLAPEIQLHLSKLGIEFLDRKTITDLLEEKEITQSTIEQYSGLYAFVGPQLFAAALPIIAEQRIPSEMREHARKMQKKPWEVFEDAVFSVFHHCLRLTTQKLGGERLFEHEPEGIVVVDDQQRFALIYECKSATKSYSMTSDHALRYKDYIRKKTKPIAILRWATLKYFVIIAPNFSGKIDQRREKIFHETQVLTVFLPACVLSHLGKWACGLPNDIKQLIDLGSIFKLGEVIVSEKTVRQYIREFNRENKGRW